MTQATASPILQQIRRIVTGQRSQAASDQDLLRQFAGTQDEEAFHALLQRHGPMVLGVCRSVLRKEAEVEDAFQATFLTLARKAGSVHKAAALGSWLYGVAYRTALKAQEHLATRRKHEARVPQREAPEDELSWREVQ